MILNSMYLGDCLEIMPQIKNSSIDMILCDLPYGTTACKWDTIIPFDKLWEQYKRIIKDNGVIVLTASQPFTSALVMSNIEMFKYEWIWEKESCTGHLNVNYKPLKKTEDILVFSKANVGSLSKNKIRYFPQGVIIVNKQKHNNPNSTWRKNKGYSEKTNILNSKKPFIQKYTGYPSNILSFPRDKNAVHPTQKPVSLFEYLIKTYTNEGDLVLDNCSGSGTTAIAAINTKRNYICIEKEQKYFDIGYKRIKNAKSQLLLF